MESVEYLRVAGNALSVNEKTAIRCSLAILSQQRGQQFTFWGKIQGYQNDYLIAQCAKPEGTLLDIADSFFSVDGGTNWTALEPITPEQKEFCDQVRGPFMGDAHYEYKLQRDLPPEEPAALDPAAQSAEAKALADKAPEDEEDAAPEEGEGEEGQEDNAEGEAPPAEEGEEGAEEKKPQKKRPKFQILTMQEKSRLSYFITEHDQVCKIIPRGSYLQHPDGTMVRNRTYRGLDVENAQKVENYFKLKEQLNPQKNAQLFGATYSAPSDFLQSITFDMPQGVWSCKYDSTLSVVTVQNLDYLGSFFYHKPDTQEFGQFYVGTGERNLDLCFMLPSA